MDSDPIVEMLEQVLSRLDDLERDVGGLSAGVDQVRIQGDELFEEIQSVKRAVDQIDPIL